MISFKVLDPQNNDLIPEYKTEASAAADLMSAEDIILKANSQGIVKTGIYIDQVDWAQVPNNTIPELQVRARSGLAYKNGITLTNAVGTIDADYPGEICVLMWNTSGTDFEIKRGDRIAQILLNLVHRLTELNVGGKRLGGFGSTGVTHSTENSANA
jgi:dUTP pyrophosphatase